MLSVSVPLLFLASGGKRMQAIRTKLSGCIQLSGGCVFALTRVHNVRDTCCEASSKLHLPKGQTQQRRISTVYEKNHTTGGYVLLVTAECGAQRMPVRGILSISGDLHHEDTCHRTSRAVVIKVGRLMANAISFHRIST